MSAYPEQSPPFQCMFDLHKDSIIPIHELIDSCPSRRRSLCDRCDMNYIPRFSWTEAENLNLEPREGVSFEDLVTGKTSPLLFEDFDFIKTIAKLTPESVPKKKENKQAKEFIKTIAKLTPESVPKKKENKQAKENEVPIKQKGHNKSVCRISHNVNDNKKRKKICQDALECILSGFPLKIENIGKKVRGYSEANWKSQWVSKINSKSKGLKTLKKLFNPGIWPRQLHLVNPSVLKLMPPPRYGMACTNCYKSKVKCQHPWGSPCEESPCYRCAKRGKTCLVRYQQHSKSLKDLKETKQSKICSV